MGDPEMVSRAERAAVSLERAWERWRIMHGLSAEPTPPVSSYVGYSIEEPWGRPRVVFGVDAKEAELLAALLDRHECVGPFFEPSLPGGGQDMIQDGHRMMHDGQGFLPVSEEVLLDGHAAAAAEDSPDLAPGGSAATRDHQDGHGFPAKAERHHRDDGAEEPGETSNDYVSLNGAGAQRPAGPAESDSAGPAAAGQAESADEDYQEVAGGFDQADGHDEGFAGGDPGGPAGSGYADVADGLLQAADGDLAGQAGPDLGGPGADYHGNMSIAAELAGWAAGELPGQASARLAEWAAMGRAPKR